MNQRLNQIKLKMKSVIQTLQDKWIMRYEVLILATIMIVAVTIAWYTFSVNAKMSGLSLTASKETTWIKIANSSGGEDLAEGTDVNWILSEDESRELQPGMSGTIDLYITSLSTSVNAYEIVLTDVLKGGVNDEEREISADIKPFIQSHILFFGTKTEADGKVTYSNPLGFENLADGTEKQVLKGFLEQNKEKHVPIYWVWPYEYDAIPNVEPSTITYENINKYNYEDMQIGSSIDQLQYQFRVSGIWSRESTSK